nr:MAG TPA: hypothetical protein [Caudoviricetes sp.]
MLLWLNCSTIFRVSQIYICLSFINTKVIFIKYII